MQVASNGWPSSETGFPPFSREVAARGLESLMKRTDAWSILQASAQSQYLVKAISSLLTGKLEKLQAMGVRCFDALRSLAATAPPLVMVADQIVSSVPSPIARKLEALGPLGDVVDVA